MIDGPPGPQGRPRPETLVGLRSLNARNRGPFTLDGTRTYLVGEREVAVIDPGPSDDAHRAALADALAGAEEACILLTHGHADHAGGAHELADLIGARVLGPGLPDSASLGDGDQVHTDAGDLKAVFTPGHTRDHLCFWWPEQRALFAGDVLLGEGDTTWVAEYPACVADYLASLDRIDTLEPDIILPAHGPPLTQAKSDVERFRSHRLARIDQVRVALEYLPGGGSGGTVDAGVLLEAVYGALPLEVRPAAEASLAAILQYLKRDA